MRNFQHLMLLAMVATLVSGCGGSSSNPAPSSGSDTSAIAGFWDVSEENDSGEQDIYYALISANGMVTEYDYDQDAAGSGRNCYVISTSTLTAISNNQYQQSDEIEGGFDTFTATRQGTVLTVSFVDEDDDNQNGSTTDLITETYNELTSIDPATLEDCNTASSPTDIPVLSSGGLVVGGFDESRGGTNAIDVGAFKPSLETHITDVTILTTATLTDAFLDQVDVFIVDVVSNSGTAISRLNLAETAALESFVNGGGGLLVASDNPSFQSASNSFLTPFGLTAGGIATGGLHTASVIDRSIFSDVTDGPYGQVVSVSANNTGGFSVLGEFSVLANWSSGPLSDSPAIVARSNIGAGAGRIVSVADHQTVIAGLEDSEILFLNSIYFLSKAFSPSRNSSEVTTVDMFSVTSSTSSSNPSTFVGVDVANGQQTLIGTTGGVSIGNAMDWNPITRKFYSTDSFNFPGIIHEIDSVTGTSSQVAWVRDSAGTPLEIGAIAFSSDGTLYAAEGRNVGTGLRIGIVDLDNETFSEIMPVPSGNFVPGIDIGDDGTLHAVYSLFQTGTTTTNSVVRINLQTMQILSDVALSTDFAVGDIDLAADGFLYHSNFSFTLIRVDPITGDQTNVGFGEVGAFAGLASVQ